MRAPNADFIREYDAVVTRRAFGVRFTVLVELADATWTEYHANDEDNARAIADNSVALLQARGATCWHVTVGGTLKRSPFYRRFNEGDHHADDGDHDHGVGLGTQMVDPRSHGED